ncbi:MAG: tRNA (adenosine(37)-N6)-threonylcarbamoyltransferase complex ATPase subunit type 1 TsaE [Candidatus Acidiferrales bacterium]
MKSAHDDPKQIEYVTQSAEETIARGRELAAAMQPPLLVLLSGELGSGKTTLAKGIISGLGAAREEDVTSPTFTLVHVFRILPRERPRNERGEAPGEGRSVRIGEPSAGTKVYHVDLYRVADFHDLETLGLEDALSEPAVVLVEWSDRFHLRSDWPRLTIHLEHLDGDSRRILIRKQDS